jgi:hypothetical protein
MILDLLRIIHTVGKTGDLEETETAKELSSCWRIDEWFDNGVCFEFEEFVDDASFLLLLCHSLCVSTTSFLLFTTQSCFQYTSSN